MTLIGGVVLIGAIVFVVIPAFGMRGPSLTISPNPITTSSTGQVVMTARGFKPGEELTAKVALPDGTIIPTSSEEPVFADGSGSWISPSGPSSDVMMFRLLAALVGPVTDWTLTGKTSGLSATVRLVIELIPPPATSMSLRLPLVGRLR